LTKELTIRYSKDEYSKYRVYSPYEGAPVASYFKGENVENTWNRAQICKVNPESLTADIVNINLLSKSVIFKQNKQKLDYLGESKKLAFLTLNPFKWCAIFKTIDSLLRYGTIRYGTVRYARNFGK